MLKFFGGGRGCAGALTRPSTRHLLPKNVEKTAHRKRWGIFTVKMRGGHIYGNYCTLATLGDNSVITSEAYFCPVGGIWPFSSFAFNQLNTSTLYPPQHSTELNMVLFINERI